MNPRLRSIIALVLGSGVAFWIGAGVANEDYLVATVACLLGIWGFLTWRGGPLPEAWLIAIAVLGYIVGNRGFAQFSLSRQLPLLPAEAALVVAGLVTLVRTAFRQTALIRRDALNFAILVWVLFGTARLWPDVRTHGAIALRDFAMIYYAAFFFVAQSLAQHAASARIVRNGLLIGCSVLPFTYFLYQHSPDSLLRTFSIRGTPLLYYKDDLVAAYLFAGFFLMMTVPGWPAALRITIATVAYASGFGINSSRAALVGLCLTNGWWIYARRWSPLRVQLVLVPVALLVLVLVAVTARGSFSQSRIFQLYEHVASMTDFSGTRQYTTEERSYVGDNNRFRMVWWKSIAVDVWATNPIFGLGFGYDLAGTFLRNYDLDLGDEFNVRSPHSIVFTAFGRIGLAGLAAWTAIFVAMVVRTRKAARQDHNENALTTFGWWSVSWMMFASACFGVVLEGPMGAVIFWTALGMANAGSESSGIAATEPAASLVEQPLAA